MRVVSGTARGRRLYAPPGAVVRPATDRLKQALFNILFDVTGERVLDLFAGSGSLAIEALSRGAEHATVVDDAPEAIRAIERNLAATGFGDAATVVRSDVLRSLQRMPARPWDLLFVDPPYALELPYLDHIAELLGRPGVLTASARITWERASADDVPPFPPGFELRVHRTYGQTALFVAERVVQ